MMTVSTYKQGTTDGDGYVVRRPRVTDALGKTLRQAFEPGGMALPSDMHVILQNLDRHR